LPPWQGGGDMIRSVTFEKTTYNDLPYKFEAGTPDIAGVIGLGAAIDYLDQIGMDAIAAHEHDLLWLDVRGPRFQLRTALLAKTRFFSLRENGVYPYADFES
jgi:hypothetical protein